MKKSKMFLAACASALALAGCDYGIDIDSRAGGSLPSEDGFGTSSSQPFEFSDDSEAGSSEAEGSSESSDSGSFEVLTDRWVLSSGSHSETAKVERVQADSYASMTSAERAYAKKKCLKQMASALASALRALYSDAGLTCLSGDSLPAAVNGLEGTVFSLSPAAVIAGSYSSMGASDADTEEISRYIASSGAFCTKAAEGGIDAETEGAWVSCALGLAKSGSAFSESVSSVSKYPFLTSRSLLKSASFSYGSQRTDVSQYGEAWLNGTLFQSDSEPCSAAGCFGSDSMRFGKDGEHVLSAFFTPSADSGPVAETACTLSEQHIAAGFSLSSLSLSLGSFAVSYSGGLLTASCGDEGRSSSSSVTASASPAPSLALSYSASSEPYFSSSFSFVLKGTGASCGEPFSLSYSCSESYPQGNGHAMSGMSASLSVSYNAGGENPDMPSLSYSDSVSLSGLTLSSLPKASCVCSAVSTASSAKAYSFSVTKSS